MALATIQIPTTVSPSSNYMWCIADPAIWTTDPYGALVPPYSGITGYYVQYIISNSDTFENYIINNVKIYPDVYKGYAVFDIHRVLNNYVSYETFPLSVFYGFKPSTDSLIKYNVSAFEFSGSTELTSYTKFASGYTFNATVDRNITWNYYDYILTTNTGRFLTNWIGSYTVRKTDIASLAFFYAFKKIYPDCRIKLSICKPDNTIKDYWTFYPIITSSAITTQEHYQFFGSGYKNINGTWFVDSGGTLITNNILETNSAISYSLCMTSDYISSGASAKTISETIDFIIDNDCTLIENIELMWQNDLSGWDFYTFYRERHKTLKSEKITYQKNDYGLYNGIMQTPQYTIGETVLTNKVTNYYKVKSKILTNDMSKNVSGIFNSKNVFYIEDDGTINPIIIDMDTVEVMNNYNRPNRAIYEFSFRFANESNTIE